MSERTRSCTSRGISRAFRGQHGVVLIEVLVAILLFMVGVLALVGLQASMTQAQTASKVRADAGYLANELIGVMWSDVAHITSYATASCAGYVRCNDWAAKVAQSLPSGTSAVTVQASGDVTVTITWTMPNGGTHNYTTRTTVQSAS